MFEQCCWSLHPAPCNVCRQTLPLWISSFGMRLFDPRSRVIVKFWSSLLFTLLSGSSGDYFAHHIPFNFWFNHLVSFQVFGLYLMHYRGIVSLAHIADNGMTYALHSLLSRSRSYRLFYNFHVGNVSYRYVCFESATACENLSLITIFLAVNVMNQSERPTSFSIDFPSSLPTIHRL